MEASGVSTRVVGLEGEMGRARDRLHEHGNKLAEHEADLEAVSRTLQRLDNEVANLRTEQRAGLKDLHTEMGTRFDKLSSQGWKIAAFVVSVMVLAAGVVGLVIQ